MAATNIEGLPTYENATSVQLPPDIDTYPIVNASDTLPTLSQQNEERIRAEVRKKPFYRRFRFRRRRQPQPTTTNSMAMGDQPPTYKDTVSMMDKIRLKAMRMFHKGPYALPPEVVEERRQSRKHFYEEALMIGWVVISGFVLCVVVIIFAGLIVVL